MWSAPHPPTRSHSYGERKEGRGVSIRALFPRAHLIPGALAKLRAARAPLSLLHTRDSTPPREYGNKPREAAPIFRGEVWVGGLVRSRGL